jgi:hypothetical protein
MTRPSPMWTPQLLQQIIQQNEMLRLKFEDEITILKEEIRWMKFTIENPVQQPIILDSNVVDNGTEA